MKSVVNISFIHNTYLRVRWIVITKRLGWLDCYLHIHGDTLCRTYFAAKKNLAVANAESGNWPDWETLAGCQSYSWTASAEVTATLLWKVKKNDSSLCLLWRQSCDKANQSSNMSCNKKPHTANSEAPSVADWHVHTSAEIPSSLKVVFVLNAQYSLTVAKFPKSFVGYCCCLEGAVETTDQLFFSQLQSSNSIQRWYEISV